MLFQSFCGKDFPKPSCEAFSIKHSLSNENIFFVTLEIQYFELRIFAFISYISYVTRGFIASIRAFNLLTLAFNLATRAFNFLTRRLELLTHGFELVTRGFEFVTSGFELVTRNS